MLASVQRKIIERDSIDFVCTVMFMFLNVINCVYVSLKTQCVSESALLGSDH
jgi:hypothetical protein